MSDSILDLNDDLVCTWEIRLPDGIHTVTFEHGSTSGKRVITVDGVEVLRKNWMFKLVGSECFKVGSKVAEIAIDSSGMVFEYTLRIDNKSLQKFVEAQAKNTRTWHVTLDNTEHRVVLLIDTMEVYYDGQVISTCGEFTDEGTETHFALGPHAVHIRAISSGNKRKGLLYTLVVDGHEHEPVAQEAVTEHAPPPF